MYRQIHTHTYALGTGFKLVCKYEDKGEKEEQEQEKKPYMKTKKKKCFHS